MSILDELLGGIVALQHHVSVREVNEVNASMKRTSSSMDGESGLQKKRSRVLNAEQKKVTNEENNRAVLREHSSFAPDEWPVSHRRRMALLLRNLIGEALVPIPTLPFSPTLLVPFLAFESSAATAAAAAATTTKIIPSTTIASTLSSPTFSSSSSSSQSSSSSSSSAPDATSQNTAAPSWKTTTKEVAHEQVVLVETPEQCEHVIRYLEECCEVVALDLEAAHGMHREGTACLLQIAANDVAFLFDILPRSVHDDRTPEEAHREEEDFDSIAEVQMQVDQMQSSDETQEEAINCEQEQKEDEQEQCKEEQEQEEPQNEGTASGDCPMSLDPPQQDSHESEPHEVDQAAEQQVQVQEPREEGSNEEEEQILPARKPAQRHVPSPLFAAGLKRLLESDRILKIIHDCRGDSDLLFGSGVILANVFDTQIAYCVVTRERERSTPLPVGLNTLLRRYGSGLVNQFKQVARVEMEQSDEYWTRRPLDEVMIRYSAQDVLFLPNLYKQLCASLSGRGYDEVLEVSKQYLDQYRTQSAEITQLRIDRDLWPRSERKQPETDREIDEQLSTVPRYNIEKWDRLALSSLRFHMQRKLPS
mmetsp:Transcript_17817/g.53495  ORF Transcript_17817/g.53495 Transcript_17817/m.53495 type:complete len:591 (-) Transcript_17817:423-2195(-)